MSDRPAGEGTRFSLFDVNAMLGPMPTGPSLGDVDELLTVMDSLGVTAAVTVHSYAWRHDVAAGNSLVLKEVGDEPRCRPAWVVLPPTCGELPEPRVLVSRAEDAGVAAFRLYPHDHGYDLLGPDSADLLGALAAYRAPALIDVAQAGWPALEEVARRYPDLPVVVTDVGYRALRSLVGALERRPNLHVDLSYLGSHAGLEWLVARCGAGRVLFGTGLPDRDPADAVTRLLWSELDDVEVAAVAGGNLRRLLSREPST